MDTAQLAADFLAAKTAANNAQADDHQIELAEQALVAARTQLAADQAALAAADATVDTDIAALNVVIPPVDPPTTTTRVAVKDPYIADSWVKRKLGSGAVYGASAGIVYGYVNAAAYSENIYYTTAVDPARTITGPWGSVSGVHMPTNAQASLGTDGISVFVQPDGRTVHAFYQFNGSTNSAQTHVLEDLETSNAYDVGWISTSRIGPIAGIILKDELVAAGQGTPFAHALRMALPGGILGKYFQWPATAQDQAAPEGTSKIGNTGNVNYGARLAIRPGVDLNTIGLTTQTGHAAARTAQQYGIVVCDFGGQPVLFAEGRCEPVVNGARAPMPQLTDLRNDCAAIYKQLVVVTNGSNSDPKVTGRPGTADGGCLAAPDAPPFA